MQLYLHILPQNDATSIVAEPQTPIHTQRKLK